MRIVLVLSAAAAAAAMAGCRDERPEPPRPPDLECHPLEAHFTFIATDTPIFRQGTTVRVTPTVDVSPAGTREIPLRCTADWSVAGPARLSADRTSVVIEADAAPGAVVTVGFRHGTERIERRMEVIARDAVVLTGRRGQRSVEGCEGAEPVRELEFIEGNRFAVTFMPFETYRDYWGSYSFDPATGRLSMQAEGGNFVPPGLDLEGQAELAEGRLVLRDFYFGSRHAAPPARSCTYIF